MNKLNVLVVVEKCDKDAIITIISGGIVSPPISIANIGYVDGNPYILYGKYVESWVERFPESVDREICIQVARISSGEMKDYSDFWSDNVGFNN